MTLTWVSVSQAAAGMGLSKRQAMRRLHAMNREHGGRLLRIVGRCPNGRPSKIEVCAEVLLEIEKGRLATAETEIRAVNMRIDSLEDRLLALRNSHRAHKRKVAKELELQKKRTAALAKVQEGIRDFLVLDELGRTET